MSAGEREPADDGAVHHDPMAADRRTLTFAAAAMVLLIGLGVASAAVFTGSACGNIGPDPLEAAIANSDVPEVVRAAFPDMDESARGALIEGISAGAELLGPVLGVADVGDADRVGVLGPGSAAFGSQVTALVGDGDEVRSVAAFGGTTAVLGGGGTVFSVALANELTGQVDAVQALDSSLEPVGPCLDAATVNVPFAFHLDAGGGELLVLRSDEDGGDPEVELRGRNGSVWATDLTVPVAPPGVLGERLSGRLGEGAVVVSRRVIPGETAPAVVAMDRGDGAVRWSLAPEDLPHVGEAAWVQVLGVSAEVVVLGIASDAARDEQALVGLDVADGSVVWSDDAATRAVGVVVDDRHAVELVDHGGGLALRVIDAHTGERGEQVAVEGDRLRSARLDSSSSADVASALGPGGLLVWSSPGDAVPLSFGVPVRDVAAHPDGRLTVLLGDGAAAVTVTFGV